MPVFNLLCRFCFVLIFSVLFLSCGKNEDTQLTLAQSCCDGEVEISGEYDKTEAAIYFPNVFTPNGDRLNETFYPITRGIKSIKWEVTKTFGTVYTTEDLKGKWDGKDEGKIKSKTYNFNGAALTNKDEVIRFKGKVKVLLPEEELPCSDCTDCHFEDQVDPEMGFVNASAETQNIKCADPVF